MAPRFHNIKFNLLRAIEFLQDMNHQDMEVDAPPSGPDHYYEYQVATKLNQMLTNLIDDGFFDECELRSTRSSDRGRDEEEVEDEDLDEDLNEDEEDDDRRDSGGSSSTPESEGFDYDERNSEPERNSQGSFTNRFRRYVKRMLPERRRS